MSFSVDHSQAANQNILPEGEYECIIENAHQTVTRMGTPYIDIPLIIRKDVKNPRKGGKIFHKLWMKKEPTPADIACEGYSAKQIQSLSKAADLPNGKAYANIDEWCADLAGKPIRVTIEHSEYKGQKNARVSWTNATKFPTIVAMDDETYQATNGEAFTPVDPDDVPF